MMNKKQLLESQKECAKMLGMTLEEYNNYLKNAKVNVYPKKTKEKMVLKMFGINKNQLKTKRGA